MKNFTLCNHIPCNCKSIQLCHLVPQVFVAQTNYHPGLSYGHYLTVWEADGNVEVCLKTNGMITDPLYVDIETTKWDTSSIRYTPAIGISKKWCFDNKIL